MWFHFVNLFWRIVHGVPLLLSSNWADKIWGLGVFVLTQVFLALNKRHHMKQWWENKWKNLATGVAAVAIGYVSLFVWSTVQTVYDDHHDSVGRWKVVVLEKNELKSQLANRDRYIATLEQRKYPTCATRLTATHAPASQPESTPPPMAGNVRVASQKTVVSIDKDFPYALEVILQTDTSIEPVAFALECDGEIGKAMAGFNSGGVYVQTKYGFVNDSHSIWGFEWNSPAFTAERSIVVTIYSKTYVRVKQLHRITYVWP